METTITSKQTRPRRRRNADCGERRAKAVSRRGSLGRSAALPASMTIMLILMAGAAPPASASYDPPDPVLEPIDDSGWSARAGEWVKITIAASNTGGQADWQTLHISFPDGPPAGNIRLVGHDLDSAEKYPPNSHAFWSGYGQEQRRLPYTVVEGVKDSWGAGHAHEMTIEFKPEEAGQLEFRYKTVAGRSGDLYYDPAHGATDGQDEHVTVGTISVEAASEHDNDTRSNGDFVVERRNETDPPADPEGPEPGPPGLPDNKIGNALRGNPHLLANARAYADEAAALAERVEPAVEGLERVLAVRDYLEEKEAFGVTAWDALTTAEPTTGAIMDSADAAHRELSGVHATARGLERAGTDLNRAITPYASDPSPQNEDLVRSAFGGAVPAYRQASSELSRAAGHLTAAAGRIEDLQSYLVEHEDRRGVGPYFREAADRIGGAASAVRGIEDDLRAKAADLDRDADVMEEALSVDEATSPIGWPAPLLAAAMLALLACAARRRSGRKPPRL